MGQLEQEQTEQDYQEKTAKIGLSGKYSQKRAARSAAPAQDY
jgi:hypothetical protein